MPKSKRILFLPVSSTVGMGEYVRSLCLAKELSRVHPDMQLAFGLNRNAMYIDDCPFEVFPLDDTPTRCTGAVLEMIDQFAPDLVIFDASGRVRQFAGCKRRNIRTVFIAQHQRKLNRALRFRRIKYTDLILVAQPPAFIKSHSILQKCWLKLFNKNSPVVAGPIFANVSLEQTQEYLQESGLVVGEYVVVNAGGGGNMLSSAGKNVAAIELFVNAIQDLAREANKQVVVIPGRNYKGVLTSGLPNNVKVIPHCEEHEFNILLANASAALLSGGSALLQAIASGLTHILAVPVAKDQKERIALCEKHYDIESCIPELEPLKLQCRMLFRNRDVNAKALRPAMENGLQKAVNAILSLLDETPR